MYMDKNPIGRSTISRTWEFAPEASNTLEQSQIEKLSFAPEKGDKICGGPAYAIVYSIQI
jgi:hypothetical protein